MNFKKNFMCRMFFSVVVLTLVVQIDPSGTGWSNPVSRASFSFLFHIFIVYFDFLINSIPPPLKKNYTSFTSPTNY